MIVVSNTSPITNLAAIGRLDLLRSEFSQVQIADAVWEELNAKSTQWPGAREVSDAPWIVRRASRKHALVNALRLSVIISRLHDCRHINSPWRRWRSGIEIGIGAIVLNANTAELGGRFNLQKAQ